MHGPECTVRRRPAKTTRRGRGQRTLAGQSSRTHRPPGPCEAASRSESATTASNADHTGPDDMRVSRGMATPRHRPANPAVGRPEQHRPAYEGRSGHDFRRSSGPKPGGRHEWWRRERGSGWSRRGHGVGPGPAGGEEPRRRTPPPSPGSASAPPAAATRRQPANQLARPAAHHPAV